MEDLVHWIYASSSHLNFGHSVFLSVLMPLIIGLEDKNSGRLLHRAHALVKFGT